MITRTVNLQRNVYDIKRRRSIRWLLLAVGTALILLVLAACNGQQDGTPAAQGAAADSTPTSTATESPTPSPTVVETATQSPTVTKNPTPTTTVTAGPTPSPTAGESSTPSPTFVHPGQRRELDDDPFAMWNALAPQDWWRESEPYTCLSPEKDTSPWIKAGMTDLGGSEPPVAHPVLRQRQLPALRLHGLRGVYPYEEIPGAHLLGSAGRPDLLLTGRPGHYG